MDIADLEAEVQPLSAEDPRRPALEARIRQFERIGAAVRPRRRYDAVHLGVSHRFAAAQPWFVDARYTWSRLEGNVEGWGRSDTGQLDPVVSSLWDSQGTMHNTDSALPGDRPHQLRVLASTDFVLDDAGVVTAGLVVKARSGVPRNVLGRSPSLGENEVHLLPRGRGGRGPAEWQVGVRVAYAKTLSPGVRLTLFADVYNALDHQAATVIDHSYTSDYVSPIVGGDEGDLRFAKRDSAFGVPTGSAAPRGVRKNPSYGSATARQAPIGLGLGVRLDF